MKKYKVVAQQHVEAENPLRAAEAFANMMDDPLTMLFEVREEGSDKSIMVDLDDELHEEMYGEEDEE